MAATPVTKVDAIQNGAATSISTHYLQGESNDSSTRTVLSPSIPLDTAEPWITVLTACSIEAHNRKYEDIVSESRVREVTLAVTFEIVFGSV